jgi:hypothetical protein
MLTLACRTSLIVIALAFTFSPSPAESQSRDRTKPTMPGNFRVIAKTAYTVTLAWDPSTDNSGNFSYHLWGAYNVGPTLVLPKAATTYTFSALFPSNTYTFGIYAKDAAGNASTQANLSGVRLPRDTSPPTTAPAVTIDEVGANYAIVSWIPAADDGPHLSTQIYLNGAFYAGVGRGVTTATLRSLEPGTTYNLTLRAVDFSNNAGPLGAAVNLMTPPPNPNDQIAPSMPGNIQAMTSGDGSTETHVRWTQSTDNLDAQSNLRYDVYVNGVWEDVIFGSGGPSIIYGQFGQNVIEVFATDTSGNTSEPAIAVLSIAQ